METTRLTLVPDAAQNRVQVRLQFLLHQLQTQDPDGPQGLVQAVCREKQDGGQAACSRPTTSENYRKPLTTSENYRNPQKTTENH